MGTQADNYNSASVVPATLALQRHTIMHLRYGGGSWHHFGELMSWQLWRGSDLWPWRGAGVDPRNEGNDAGLG